MAHWQKSYPSQQSQFNSIAGWAIGATVVVAALVFIASIKTFSQRCEREAVAELRFVAGSSR